MTANDDRIDARDWSLLAVLSVLWGGSFFFNGVVLKELPPLTVVLLRVALAAMILLPVLRAYQIRFPAGLSGWKPFFAIALLNNVLPFSLIVMGQTYIPSGLASILNATTPLFTVLVMAADGDDSIAGVRSDDDDCGGCLRTAVAAPDAGRDHMAGDDWSCGIVDRARLHRIFSGPATFGLDQRHAGDAPIPVTGH